MLLCWLGFRVRRLGYYDHTQRQLGERALYVFPAKGDATRITCEGPEGAPVLTEDPVARKVRIKSNLYMSGEPNNKVLSKT